MSKVVKAVGKAVSGVVKAVVGVVKSVVKAVVGVVSAVVNFIAQPFMGLLGGPGGMPNAGQEAARQDGVLVQRQGSNNNIPVVYGMRKIGGNVVFAETGSSNNQYLWVAYVLSEGRIEGVRELYIDDFKIDDKYIQALQAGEGAPVDITDGKYNGRVRLQFYPGTYYSNTAGSPVGTNSILADSPSWSNKMIYNGLAVLFVRYFWKKVETQADADNNPFGGGIPEIKATLLGRRIASLVTNTSEGIEYEGAGYSERYSTNPAEILLDYLRNPRYGKGLKNTDIDWNTWRKACTKCNQVVEYIQDVRGPIMTCNFVLDTGQTIFANVKSLLMGFRAYMPYVQGKYKLKIEDAGNEDDILSGVATIVATFTPDNIQGNVQFTGIDRTSKYNQVTVTYVEPDQKYSTQQMFWPESEAEKQLYIQQDGGRENKLEATFPTLTNYAMAKDMARLLFNKSRRQETCTLTVSSQALELEPGDNIRIQSNILDFDEDPWRIVSLKINDDMTVELGCVRNPDDIYPHARFNEEDIVLPPFIPDGASIYYPKPDNPIGDGLIPPPWQPQENPTDPTGPDGGGVGAPDSPINIQPPIAPPEPERQLLIDAVTIDRVTYRAEGVQVYATIEFKQPLNAMYDSLDFWYKGQADNGYRKVRITEKPGPGLTVRYTLGPLIARQYQVFARVNYSTGETSARVTNSLLGAYEYAIQENPDDIISYVVEGWSLPDFVPTIQRNNKMYFGSGGYTILNSGVPTRTFEISVRQNVFTANPEAPNYDISGLIVYWKRSNETYWYEKEYFVPSNYVPGSTFKFIFNEDLGAVSYPSIPTSASQNHDFILRWTYKDGKQSTEQNRYMNVPVERTSGGLYDYGPFTPLASTLIQERSSNYEILRIADNPGVVVNVLDTLPGLKYILGYDDAPFSPAYIRIGCIPPDNISPWRGLKIYFRPVNPTQNPVWQTVEQTNITQEPEGTVSVRFDMPSNSEYELVILALVRSGSATVEARKGWYLKGFKNGFRSGLGVPTTFFNSSIYGNRPNWKESFSPKESLVADILKLPQVASPNTAVAQISEWKYIKTKDTAFDINTAALTSYYQLGFYVGHIANYNQAYVYRRNNKVNAQNTLVVANNAPYFGFGQWERVTVASAPDANGYVFVNLRMPITYSYFNPKNIGSTPTDPSSLLNWMFFDQLLTGNYTYPICPASRGDEFIVVIEKTVGGVPELSSKGILLRGWADTGFKVNVNILNTDRVQEVTLADYNTVYLANYLKRLSEFTTRPGTLPTRVFPMNNARLSENGIYYWVSGKRLSLTLSDSVGEVL
jgi:hypothetical protein